MIRRPAIATLFAVGICLTFVTVHAPVTAADPAQAVDAIFSSLSSADSPGCAVGVARDGRPVLTNAYGSADLEHDVWNTPDTIFEAGSVSKQFTAAAVLLLAQQGRLSLADDIRKYLPEVPDYGPRITIDHFLSHTSGLRDWGTVLEAAGRPRGTAVYTQDDVLDVVSRQRGVNFRPGSEYLYNNTGYSLLPIVVERVSGMSFAAFTKQNFFDPLGMRHTEWRDDFTRVVKGRAVAYSPVAGAFAIDMPFENVHGHAGLLTTVGDLLIWNENFDSGKAGGQRLVAELQRPARLSSGRSIGYARGLVVSKYRGVAEVSHSGSTAGYRSFVARYPDDRLSVVVLCNSAHVKATQLAHQVADVFLTSPQPGSPPPPPVKLTAGELSTRVGLYRNRRTNQPLALTVVNGALRAESGETLIPLSGSKFRFEGSARRIEFPSERGPARLVTDEGDVVPLERVKPAAPLPAELARYEGKYYSDEAEATYTVAIVNDELVLRQRPGSSMTLTPAYADAFTASRGWTVRFVRDGGGRVTALSLGLGRIRDLRFTRVNQ